MSLEKYKGETKKTVSSLAIDEVSFVLEYFTQNNQVENFNEFFANNVKPEQPKAEKPKQTAKKAKGRG